MNPIQAKQESSVLFLKLTSFAFLLFLTDFSKLNLTKYHFNYITTLEKLNYG